MGIKLHESGQVIICAKADPDQQFDMQWISKHTKDWAIANVTTFGIDASLRGEGSTRIMITFDASICEQSETTS